MDVVVTDHRSVSPVDVGAAVPARVEALMWPELQMVDAALLVPGCTECLGPASDTRRDSHVLQEVCCLREAVPPRGRVTGGSEQAAQHQRR